MLYNKHKFRNSGVFKNVNTISLIKAYDYFIRFMKILEKKLEEF